MFGWLKPAPAAPPLPTAEIDAVYTRQRRQVFAGIFLGYAAYYLVRNNLALAIPDILEQYPQYSKAQLGTALTGLSLAYGLSKFLMGSVSDRSNPKYFLPLGLLLSCAIMAVCGLVPGIYTSLTLLIALMTLNGWVQGMGWPPCGKTMVHWFGTKERGLVVATWNVSHNVGGALVANFALLGVMLFSDWGAKFYFNALIAGVVAIVVFFLLRDTPQSSGLPPDRAVQERLPARLLGGPRAHVHVQGDLLRARPDQPLLVGDRVRQRVRLLRPLRRGELDPHVLETAKGFSFKESSIAWSLYEWAAIPGTLACGWVSDRWFKGKRAPANILFMGLTLIAVLVYWGNIHGPLWIDYAALIAIGFLIYGPIMIIGLHALDLVPKKAAGTAAGFTGFFGYVFGSAIAGTGVGWIADHYGWNGVFITMVACCLLTMGFVALTLGHRVESHGRH